ncbi:head-tail connector protein [Hymenobacter convexus]|uniref:head-tail connector protein n=1 Tax=Hymenobacter sp. CA1UV-4 TaxID=3063782 RepID=UPI002713B466|nr:head-tail connector protein [Hymenobacter sp. CA1UV-4]MDO7851394.1 head-tail connector protein [Hymenobacter sp. CA1UV-4]
MPLPITLADAKAQCRIPDRDTAEDALLQSYLVVAGAVFEKLSKRSFDATGDEALTAGELAIAGQWLLLMVAHLYDTRQPVITDVRAVSVEVPKTLDFLMDLIRVPSL